MGRQGITKLVLIFGVILIASAFFKEEWLLSAAEIQRVDSDTIFTSVKVDASAAPLYESNMGSLASVENWVMEGPGVLEFRDGWMEMFSPGEENHHVFWCPQTFPDNFTAEWEAHNLNTDAGLVIVFFAALGVEGKDIFDPALADRDGTFDRYIKGDIHSYHISYHGNTPAVPNRQHSHLRKNNEFVLVSKGPIGIPANSELVHKIKLIKKGSEISFFVDNQAIINWTDDLESLGFHHKDGKIGFRQMRWTHFRYRNFKVLPLD